MKTKMIKKNIKRKICGATTYVDIKASQVDMTDDGVMTNKMIELTIIFKILSFGSYRKMYEHRIIISKEQAKAGIDFDKYLALAMIGMVEENKNKKSIDLELNLIGVEK